MAFKDNLCRLRKEKGFINRRKFAMQTLKIDYSTYNGYEVRGSLPPEELIIKIAQVLNVTIDELFGYDATTKKTDIEIAIEELNRLGIKAVLDEEHQEVGIYINESTRYTSIPYDESIEIIKSAKNAAFLNGVKKHIIYSVVMQALIRYANTGAKTNKKIASIKKTEASAHDNRNSDISRTKKKSFTKKDQFDIKHFLDGTLTDTSGGKDG